MSSWKFFNLLLSSSSADPSHGHLHVEEAVMIAESVSAGRLKVSVNVISSDES